MQKKNPRRPVSHLLEFILLHGGRKYCTDIQLDTTFWNLHATNFPSSWKASLILMVLFHFIKSIIHHHIFHHHLQMNLTSDDDTPSEESSVMDDSMCLLEILSFQLARGPRWEHMQLEWGEHADQLLHENRFDNEYFVPDLW